MQQKNKLNLALRVIKGKTLPYAYKYLKTLGINIYIINLNGERRKNPGPSINTICVCVTKGCISKCWINHTEKTQNI